MRLNRADAIKAKEIADKYEISVEDMKNIVSSTYSFIDKKTKELNLPDDLTEDEFDKIKTNFNIPALGKLHASYYIYSQIQAKKLTKNR